MLVNGWMGGYLGANEAQWLTGYGNVVPGRVGAGDGGYVFVCSV